RGGVGAESVWGHARAHQATPPRPDKRPRRIRPPARPAPQAATGCAGPCRRQGHAATRSAPGPSLDPRPVIPRPPRITGASLDNAPTRKAATGTHSSSGYRNLTHRCINLKLTDIVDSSGLPALGD